MVTRDVRGWEYPKARAIIHPFALDEGMEILTYDHTNEAWARIRVVLNTGALVRFHALEGDSLILDWYDTYENIRDSEIYLNPGRYDL